MGFGAAQGLPARGASVVMLGRKAEKLADKAQMIGAIPMVCDVGDEAAAEPMFGRVADMLGPARVFIRCAADARMFPLLDASGSPFDGDRLREVIRTNVLGTLYLACGFAAGLQNAFADAGGLRGVLVNVSSAGAADGVMGAAYCASKGAVDSPGLSLACEFSRLGVRVMTIAPGGIDTEVSRAGAVDGTHVIIGTMVLSLVRPGRCEEFVELALHICGNDYLNGSVIRLDGGLKVPFRGKWARGLSRTFLPRSIGYDRVS